MAHRPEFLCDPREDEWVLLRHVSLRIDAVSEKNLVLLPLMESWELLQSDEMMRRIFEHNADYGQEDAERLLSQKSETLKRMRNFLLPFSGTWWKNSVGLDCIPAIVSDGDCPRLIFVPLHGHFWNSKTYFLTTSETGSPVTG